MRSSYFFNFNVNFDFSFSHSFIFSVSGSVSVSVSTVVSIPIFVLVSIPASMLDQLQLQFSRITSTYFNPRSFQVDIGCSPGGGNRGGKRCWGGQLQHERRAGRGGGGGVSGGAVEGGRIQLWQFVQPCSRRFTHHLPSGTKSRTNGTTTREES